MAKAILNTAIILRKNGINLTTLLNNMSNINPNDELYITDRLSKITIYGNAVDKFPQLKPADGNLITLNTDKTLSGILPNTAYDFYLLVKVLNNDTTITFGDGNERKIATTQNLLFNLKDYDYFTNKNGELIIKVDKQCNALAIMLID